MVLLEHKKPTEDKEMQAQKLEEGAGGQPRVAVEMPMSSKFLLIQQIRLVLDQEVN